MSETNYLKGSCKRCGNHIEFPATASGSVVNCPHCGQPTQLLPGEAARTASDDDSTSTPEPKRFGAGLLAGVCLLVLLLAGAGFFFLKHHRAAATSTTAKTPETATQPTTTQPAAKPTRSPGDLKAGEAQLEKTKDTSLVYVVGTVTNNSDSQRFGVKIELDLLSQDGKKVGTAQDYTPILEPHAAWQFRALVTDPRTASAKVADIKEE